MKNLVFIIADQLSRSILLPFCNKDYGFEALKQLAEHGIIATKYHTPSAVCTPSRGCILTGLTPFRHGAYRNGKNIGMDVKGCASVLKDNGYDVSYIGKWHLGKNRQMGDSLKNDNLLGFSFIGPEVEIGHAKSISKDGKTLFATIQENEEYTTDYLTRNAISYIDKACKSPFALFISYPDPHQPYLVRKPYSNMYAPYEMSIPETFYQEKLPDWAEEDEWGRQHYFPLSMFERKEYPRPQFRREGWQNLNGEWEFAFDDKNEGIKREAKGCSVFGLACDHKDKKQDIAIPNGELLESVHPRVVQVPVAPFAYIIERNVNY